MNKIKSYCERMNYINEKNKLITNSNMINKFNKWRK